MGVSYNPRIVTDGLVFCVDAANKRSYPGAGTVWTDLTKNKIDGTLTNGPTFDSANGGSIVFDGTDDEVNTNQQIQFDNTDPYTLSAWIYASVANNNQIINNENTSYRGYQFGINPSQYLYLFLRNTVTTNYIGIVCDNVFPTDIWKYVTATHDGSSSSAGLKIYINGVEQSVSQEGTLTSTTVSDETTLIGRRRPTTQGAFNGNIALAQIYNRALTAEEIKQNYKATKGRFEV